MPYAAYSAAVPIGLYILVLELVLAASVLLLAYAILRDSEEDGWAVRLYLKSGLARSRLGRMLARHGIGLDRYIDALSIPAVKRQVQTCRRCPRKQLCDLAYDTARPASLDAEYCPNLPEIQARLRAQPLAA